MKRILALLALWVAPVAADPLELIDYEALFAENPDQVTTASDNRKVLQMGDIVLLRDQADGISYTGIDQSGQGAVGCFVSVLASLESALQACEVTLSPEQKAISDAYRAEALAFYAENAFPRVELAEVARRYDALVASEIEMSRPFCSDLSVVTDFSDRLFVDETRAEVEGMMSIPRLPVANPCL